jgi:hypothetical protein
MQSSRFEQPSDDQASAVNPYAPPHEQSRLMLPGAAGVALGDRVILFRGAVTIQEVAKSLSPGPRGCISPIFACFILAQLVLMITSGGSLPISLVLMLVGGLGFLAYSTFLTSGSIQARRLYRELPRAFAEHHATLSSRQLRIESEYGWSELTWESIVGIKMRSDGITLALNPQHAAFVFLQKRFFSEADWNALYPAFAMLAPSLPFRKKSLYGPDSMRMASGELGPFDRVPESSILLDGVLSTTEVMQSGYGTRIIRNWTIFALILLVVFGLFAWELASVFSFSLWLIPFALVPGLILFRVLRLIMASFGVSSKPMLRLKAGVAEEGLRMATPRSNSMVGWSLFTDAVVSEKLILLRETKRSSNVVPLPRSALVDAKQWDRLVELVRRKVNETATREMHG